MAGAPSASWPQKHAETLETPRTRSWSRWRPVLTTPTTTNRTETMEAPLVTAKTNDTPSAKIVLDFANHEYYLVQSPYWNLTGPPTDEEELLRQKAWTAALEGAGSAGFELVDEYISPEEDQPDGTTRWRLRQIDEGSASSA